MLFQCTSQPEIEENSLKRRYFSISRSFKVINFRTPEKVVSSACYDKQQVCVSISPGLESVPGRDRQTDRDTAPEQPVDGPITQKWPNQFLRIILFYVIKFANFNEF